MPKKASRWDTRRGSGGLVSLLSWQAVQMALEENPKARRSSDQEKTFNMQLMPSSALAGIEAMGWSDGWVQFRAVKDLNYRVVCNI